MADHPLSVVIFVHRFHPEVGGVEMTAQVLARGFAERYGDHVTVVTHTQDSTDDANFPFRVLREPSRRELLEAVRNADVVLHNNPCMQFAWSTWLTRRPVVIAIRQFVTLPGQEISPRDRVKYHFKYATIEGADELVANSEVMSRHLRTITTVIPNSYRDRTFLVTNPSSRTRQRLAYVGRLTPDKGADLVIKAIARLRARGYSPTAIIMGDGPERGPLEELAARLGVADDVTFTGVVDGPAAARELNRCAIAVVPSKVPESFGTVALEEAACGCVVVGANHGGLVEAIGPCGPLFEPSNDESLATVLEELFTNDEQFEKYLQEAPQHLDKHAEHTMVDGYHDVLQRVSEGRGRNVDSHTLRGAARRMLSPGPQGGF